MKGALGARQGRPASRCLGAALVAASCASLYGFRCRGEPTVLETPRPQGGVSSAAAATGSRGRHNDVLHLRHVAPGGGGRLIRAASALPGVEVRRVPVPPVVRRRGLLIQVVMLRRFLQELCESRDVHVSPPTRAPGAGS